MFDKVLLPIDLNHSKSWETALPAAKQCAGADGELHLLGIVHDLGYAMVSSYLPEDFEKRAMETMKKNLADFAEAQLGSSAAAQVHVGHGHVAEAILRAVETIGADLIVMASHPPNDLQTMLIGSNASKVVRHSPIPVLVVR